MTTLDVKAEGSPEVSLARQSAPGAYVLLTRELTGADEITDEGEFPKFGDFLEVERAGSDDTEFIECPSSLARWIVDHGLEVENAFRIRSVTKIDGEWSYDCEQIEPPEKDDDDEDDDISELADAM